MKKLLHLGVVFLLLFASQVFAQNRTITGTVTAKEDGLPLPGVSVRVQGTTIGTVTGGDGKYSISIPSANNILIFTYIGFVQQQINIINRTTVNVILVSDSKQLGEVVVVGPLGIKRTAKENGYAETNITNKELTQTNVTNLANGLTGKVSGLQINTTNNGVDPSLRIVLRGNRSINNNNEALIVLDGVPVPNSTLSSINPNDIESVNVLKGAGAAALYGSEASNGALIVTTKRGTTNGKPTIKYSNSYQLQKVAYFPDFQNTFGQYGGEGLADGGIDPLTGFAKYVPYENQLYGPAFNGGMVQLGAPLADGTVNMVPYTSLGNQQKRFFNTGITEQNDVSFSQGDADNNFFFSAQNVYNSGVVPKDLSKRTALRVSGTKRYGIFKADFSVGYTNTNISTYGNGYDGSNLYTNVMQWPANVDIKSFQDPSGKFSNPNDFFSGYSINPYWIINNSRTSQRRDVLLANINLNLAPTKWFDATYRLAQNYGIYQQRNTRQQVNFSQYAISDPLGAGNRPSNYPSGIISGQVFDITRFGDGGNGSNPYSRLQQDVLLNFHHTFFDDFKANLILGNTIWQRTTKQINAGSNNLLIPDFYNINSIGGVISASEGEATIRQIAAFGSLNIGYKDYAFIEATGRNDWDSRLAKQNRSFFYPSIKGSFIFTQAIDALKNNSILSYGKLRASFSKVGQVSIGPYSINNVFNATSGFPYGNLGGYGISTQLNNPNLKPEIVREVEFGTELGFLDSRINVIGTYFNQKSTNQTFGVGFSPATGYSSAVINAGELQSKGYEIDLRISALTKKNNKVSLDVGGNLAINQSKVISLIGDTKQFQIVGASTNIYAVVGQPYPAIQGTDLLRDPQGRVIVSPTTGYPIVNSVQQNFGRTSPKFILGLNTSIGYKFVTLTAIAEYRAGYQIFNSIGSTLNFAGLSAISAAAGRQRFVYPNSVLQNPDGSFTPNTSIVVRDGNYGFWQSSSYNRVNSPFVSSAAFWKLREVNLNFNLTQFIQKTGFIKGLSFALTGRNLLLFKPKNNPWTDPEYSLDNSNAVGETSSLQTPPTRVFGGNLQVTF